MKKYVLQGEEYSCPFQLTLNVLTGKWNGLVIWFLFEHGTLRFGELKKKLNERMSVSDKMLIQALRELECSGLIERKVYKVVPPKVEYTLTKEGLCLRPVIDALENFGKAYETKK